MSIIVDKDSKVVVQGITGNEGRFHTASMLRYGTKVVAGVTPGKGGRQIGSVPVYDTVAKAVTRHGANTSIIFVPAQSARSAAIEAIDANIKTLTVITEGIPQRDVIEFVAQANKKGDVNFIGPNCPGIINPSHKIKVGIMPDHIFRPGSVHAGLGQSTCVGIGGDPIVGLDFIKVLEMFKEDEETKGVVLIGEIGGNAEELAANNNGQRRDSRQ